MPAAHRMVGRGSLRLIPRRYRPPILATSTRAASTTTTTTNTTTTKTSASSPTSLSSSSSSSSEGEAADYVIVGAGSAGCVVARRLADAGHSVLLLEAGDATAVTRSDPRSLFTRMPTALSIPMHFDAFNWAFQTEPATRLLNRRISCPRGKGLGGSSSINGMVYVRGHPLDYEAWEAAGAEGWGWRHVAPYFHKMENWRPLTIGRGDDINDNDDRHDEAVRSASGAGDSSGAAAANTRKDPTVRKRDAQLRGMKGPLHVTAGGNALGTSLFECFARAGREAGYGLVDDYNGWRQEGLGPLQRTVFHSDPDETQHHHPHQAASSSPSSSSSSDGSDGSSSTSHKHREGGTSFFRPGERCSTAAAYLRRTGGAGEKESDGIMVRTEANALQLIWDDSGSSSCSSPSSGSSGGDNGGGAASLPRAVGVACVDGRRFLARREVVLSCGAIGSPLLLQQSGVGCRHFLTALAAGASPEEAKQAAAVAATEATAEAGDAGGGGGGGGGVVRVHSPGVGRNLMDHLEFYFQFCCAGPDSLKPWLSWYRKALIGAGWLLQEKAPNTPIARFFSRHLFAFASSLSSSSWWPLSGAAGLAATNHFEAGGFIRSRAGLRYPDVQFHFLPVALSYDGVTSPPTETGHSFQLHVGTNRSLSRGSVAAAALPPPLSTATTQRPSHRKAGKEEEEEEEEEEEGLPLPPPVIDFNYMSREEDWADFRSALRLAREIVAQPAFDRQAPLYELAPGAHVDDDASLDAFLAEHLESAYHPCGTCSMGDSSRGVTGNGIPPVVSSDGRVIGAEGLRVVDASIFPTIPNGNLNGPTIMVAEKLSDAILGRPPLPPLPLHCEEGGDEEWWWTCEDWKTKQREAEPMRRLVS